MKPLSIVVVSDNQYIVLLAALIKSIEVSLSVNQKVDIYIIEDNVSSLNKKKLEKSIANANIILIWKKMKEVISNDLKLPIDRSTYPLNIYMRLFIPFFIPDDTEKVLYLDVDMIVRKDISQLFEYDLKHYVIGAVLDPSIITFDNSWGGILNYKSLGLSGNTRYFNTGLLLINISEWKKQNITEKIIDCINVNKQYANYPDQYGLNVVLANQWLELDPLWNHFCTTEHPNPFLIHFVRRKPIYQSYDNNEEYRKMFFNYLGMTEWRNFKLIGESWRYLKKMKNILNKMMN
jgi:lipopolysaccharide biosynthesis glycosyltransferase